MDKIRVLLVDDHVLFRKGLVSLMTLRPELEVVGEADDGYEALAKARELKPDLVLMDINMPNCNGLEATRSIKAEMPDARIVMLTVSEQEEDLYEAIKSGAQGYLLKNLRPESLFEMMQDAIRGEAPISPGIAAKILEELGRRRDRERDRDEPEDESSLLTQREREILGLMTKGYAEKEIADMMHVSVNTVKTHRKHIYQKLHIRSRAEVLLKF